MRRALLVATVLAMWLAACADDDAPTPTASPTATAIPSESTSTAPATATIEATPTTTATEPAQPPPRSIEGLFLEPREVPEPHIRASVGERPASLFEPWDGLDVVVYDRVSMTETNLDPGTNAIFNPSATLLTWASGEGSFARELRVLDLETGERHELGRGQPRRWMDDETLIVVDPGTGVPESMNVETGERGPAEDSDLGHRVPREESEGRWLLRRESIADDRQDEYPFWVHDFELIDSNGELGPLTFAAYEATLSPDGTLWLATPPEAAAPLVEEGPHIETGVVNLFEVDPESGEARFIASAAASAPNWPLSASTTHLAWTDNYCGLDPTAGRTRLYDRATGSMTELDRGFWLEFTADGLLGVDEFGPRALIDVTTLEYTFVLPDRAIDVQWSPDSRYAALAFAGGHGGLCG